MKAIKGLSAAVLTLAVTSAVATTTARSISGLVEAGPLCISALAARSTIMTQSGRDIAPEASAEALIQMEATVRSAHQALASMVGEAIGAALYPLPGGKPLSAGQVEELKRLCEGLYREAVDPGPLRQLVAQSVSDGLYLVHVSTQESLAVKVQVLESFVLSRAERAGLPAHAHFEEALLWMTGESKPEEHEAKK